MPTIAELRTRLGPVPDGFTDQELYEAASPVFKSLRGYDPNASNFVRGAGLAWRGVKGSLAGAGAAAADATGWESGRDAMLGYAQRQQEEAFRMGRRSDDVDNFTESPGAFLAGAAGQAAVYAIPSILGGGAGLVAGRGLGAAAGLASKEALRRAGIAGAATGSFRSNLAQETGSIYTDLAKCCSKQAVPGHT